MKSSRKRIINDDPLKKDLSHLFDEKNWNKASSETRQKNKKLKLKALNIIFSSHEAFISDVQDALFNDKNSSVLNESISFDSMETFKKVITPNKLQILIAISRTNPESINQLAKTLGRDYPHVLKDTKSLEVLGFIRIEETEGVSKQLTPKLIFDYDIMRVRTELEEILLISERSNSVTLSEAEA